MRSRHNASRAIGILVILFFGVLANEHAQSAGAAITLTVLDENGLSIRDAKVTFFEKGRAPESRWTNYVGHCEYFLHQADSYQLLVEKPGFYQVRQEQTDPRQKQVQLVLTHEQVVQQQVNVSASIPGIDSQESSDRSTMNTLEIVNVPFPTSRDIRNLLPFMPGVVGDGTGQVHVAGSETWQTLDLLDGFDSRSPVSGQLAMRVSTDAVRSIDIQSTRYPVEFGKSTGGVIAFYTGMGDNRFRFNATDFLPSFRDLNGIRFDKAVPRVTLSGPIVHNRAWFFDGVETEYDNIYIRELPANADTNHLLRGSNLFKVQVNPAKANSLTGGLLFNDYHSPNDGISPLVPQVSTTRRDTVAWLPYLRDQQRLGNGALVDMGLSLIHFHDGYEPHGTIPYEITPETALGSYFENATGVSRRLQEVATLYLAPREWLGQHAIKAGVDLDQVSFGETVARAPVNYLREDGTLLRRSIFPISAPFTHHNAELGGYLEDRWTPHSRSLRGLLVEPGLRFDWDEIVRRPLFSPRMAVVYALGNDTKLSAGAGMYYEHTQLNYLEEALVGVRDDTYYKADSVTPAGPPQETRFTYSRDDLREAHALNWSLGIEQKLPGAVFMTASYLHKTISDVFAYGAPSATDAPDQKYVLGNGRRDHDYAAQVSARRTFPGGYTLFASYTHSSARTNTAVSYVPTVSLLGPQQNGPLPWDTPDRLISWGWLPLKLPKLQNSWDFVYTADWHSGFPITSINDNQKVIGAVGSHRFPDYLSFSPGLEWRFHLRGYYFGLRGIVENATNRPNPAVVNNNVDSPQYLNFTVPFGRSFTTRIRLIESK